MYEPRGDEHLVARAAFAREAELVVNLADVRIAPLAERTLSARNEALRDAAVSRRHVRYPGADCFHDARPLVPERQRVTDVSRVDVAAQELEVGAAQAAEGRPDHDLVRSGLERRPLDE